MSMTSPFSDVTMDAGARAEAARAQEAFDATYGFRNSLLTSGTPAPPTLDKWGRAPGDPDYGKDPLGGGGGGGNKTVVASDEETATTILANTLKYYGLDDPEFVTSIKDALANRIISKTSSIDEVGIQLRDTPAFKRRFAANDARRAAGKPAYSVSQYLQLESAYRNTLRSAGMPTDFYDTQEDFQRFIANDVSPDEVQYRVQQGYQAVQEADPAVVNELKTLYGLKDSDVAAFFIDPNRARDSVVRAARAAEVAAQARTQAGIGLEAAQAERLVQQGITERQAQVGFQQVQQAQELLSPIGGEEALTQQQLIEGVLGTSGPAVQRVETTRRRRRASFEQGGAAALGQVGQ